MSGYVKHWRKMRSHPLFRTDHKSRHFFRDLLDDAAWKDTVQDWNGNPVAIARGQVMKSQREMEKEYGVSRQTIRTILSRLVKHEIVKINPQANQAPDIITICNYAKYQDINPPLTQESTHLQPTSNPQKKEGEERERKTISFNQLFDRFWKVYPRRQGKAEALKKFKSAVGKNSDLAERIIAAAQSRVGITSTDVKFIPMASTWLNQRRWEDDCEASKVAPAASSACDLSEIYQYGVPDDRPPAAPRHNAQELCGREAPDDLPDLLSHAQKSQPEEAVLSGMD